VVRVALGQSSLWTRRTSVFNDAHSLMSQYNPTEVAIGYFEFEFPTFNLAERLIDIPIDLLGCTYNSH